MPMSSNRRRCASLVPVLALCALAAGAAAPPDDPGTRPFDQAELFLELNDTDGDLGIHGAVDGGEWTRLEIEDPRGRRIMGLTANRRLEQQGLTQLAFESAEPTFDELEPEAFFRRFPAGPYEIEAKAQEGDPFESVAVLSHVLAAPAVARVGGLPAAERCDAPDLPEVQAPVLIDWDPVTTSHPTIGVAGPVVIQRYQLFVERGETKLSLDLPPTLTEFEVPTSLLPPGVYKFEIIARTSTHNNTAIESCFRVRTGN